MVAAPRVSQPAMRANAIFAIGHPGIYDALERNVSGFFFDRKYGAVKEFFLTGDFFWEGCRWGRAGDGVALGGCVLPRLGIK